MAGNCKFQHAECAIAHHFTATFQTLALQVRPALWLQKRRRDPSHYPLEVALHPRRNLVVGHRSWEQALQTFEGQELSCWGCSLTCRSLPQHMVRATGEITICFEGPASRSSIDCIKIWPLYSWSRVGYTLFFRGIILIRATQVMQTRVPCTLHTGLYICTY